MPLFEFSLVSVIWNKEAWLRCPKCEGADLIKRGWKSGHQRHVCRTCGRYCTDSQPKFGAETKAMAIEMYMNSMGIRAIGRVLGASPAAVLKWICKEQALLRQKLAHAAPVDTGGRRHRDGRDLRLRPKKRPRAVIWTAYSRRHRHVVAYHVGDNGVGSTTAMDALAKAAVGQISAIFTDANSCYHLAFERIGAPEPHQQTKARTHLIVSSNASFRDMLARFNRRTKRASKTQQMLEVTLDIFLARKRLQSPR